MSPDWLETNCSGTNHISNKYPRIWQKLTVHTTFDILKNWLLQFCFTVKTHQSSGSQSRNPLANGLLAILSWVICNMTIVITRPDLGYQSDIIRVWVSRRLMSSCQTKAPPDNDIKWAKAALPTLPLPTLTRRETNCWNQRNWLFRLPCFGKSQTWDS